MRCTGHATKGRCNTRAITALQWSEMITEGWTVTNDRCFCPPCRDAAIQRLHERGIHVRLVGLEMPPLLVTT